MTVCGLLRLDGADVRRSTLTAMLASSSLGLPAARGVHLDGPFGVITAAGADADEVPPIAVDDGGLTVVLEAAPPPAVLPPPIVPPPVVPRWLGAVPGSAGASSAPGAAAGSGAGFTDLATVPVLPLAAAPDHPKVPRHLGVVAGLSAGGAAAGGSRGVTAGWGVDDSPVGLAGAAGTEACRVAAAYRADGDSSLAGFGADKLVVVWVAARRRLTVARTGRFAADLLIWSEGGYLAFGTEPAHLLALFRAPLGPAALGPARSEAGHRPARARRLAAGDRVSVTAARRPRRAHRSGLRVVGWPLRAVSAPASASPSAPEPAPGPEPAPAPAATLAPAPTRTVMSALAPSPALAPGPALALAPVPTAAPESRDHGDG